MIDKSDKREVVRGLRSMDVRQTGEEEVIIVSDSQVVVRQFGAAPRAGKQRIYRLEMEDVMGKEDLELLIDQAHEEAARAMEEAEIDFDIDVDSLFSEEFKRTFKDLKIISPGEGIWGHKIPKDGLHLSNRPLVNTRGMKSSIEREMLRDGFISDTKTYKFVLKGNGVLRINGKRLPEGVFERYKRIYEREAGMKLEDGDEIKINR